MLDLDAKLNDGPGLADRYAVADVDSHVVEPHDLWTSRLPSKWGDLIPRVDRIKSGRQCWFFGDDLVGGVGSGAVAGWERAFPAYPPTYDEIHPGGYDPKARLAYLDDAGVYYQVLYPNISGFSTLSFLKHGQDFATDCMVAYNDFITEFCSEDPTRLIPLTVLPFWDMPASLQELDRTAEMGHRGVVLAAEYGRVGLPPLRDPYWAGLLAALQERDLSVNFHFGFAGLDPLLQEWVGAHTDVTDHVKFSSLLLLSNARAVAEVVLSGVCDQYPDLKFVSVENGVGWVSYFAESMDWQWLNSEAPKAHPDRLLPSEYIQRQVYLMYWFEQHPSSVLPRYADNVMFETDFPHPTSLSPGPASTALKARDAIDASLADVSEEHAGKILQHTATRVYRLDPPKRPFGGQ